MLRCQGCRGSGLRRAWWSRALGQKMPVSVLENWIRGNSQMKVIVNSWDSNSNSWFMAIWLDRSACCLMSASCQGVNFTSNKWLVARSSSSCVSRVRLFSEKFLVLLLPKFWIFFCSLRSVRSDGLLCWNLFLYWVCFGAYLHLKLQDDPKSSIRVEGVPTQISILKAASQPSNWAMKSICTLGRRFKSYKKSSWRAIGGRFEGLCK